MTDSGPARPVIGPGAASSTDGELAELRELIVGPERARLDELQERLRNRTQRARDLSEVLPDAIQLRAKSDPRLRQALQPLVEEAVGISVRRDPKVLAEALFPMIGGAVRRAVASALQGMVESLNQIIETSFTLRSFGWRLEALRSGKSYGEIALLRSLLYRVDEVFLIQNHTGLLLQHAISGSALAKDPDLVSAMLTAIQDFARDSFGAADNSLETVRLHDFSLWIQYGPQALLAAIVDGTPPARLRYVFSSTIEAIHRDFGEHIAAFNGDTSTLEEVRPLLQQCLLGQSPSGRRTPRAPFYVFGVALLLALIAWAGISIRDSLRWRRFLDALNREPGIVVTHEERSLTRFTLSGLKDPLARDPAELLAAAGISASRITARWEPYQSMSPRLVALREFADSARRLEQQVILFDTGKSALLPPAMISIRAAAALLKSLAHSAATAGETLRIEIVGHTDEKGSAETNAKLGLDRAQAVQSALIAFGVDASHLTARSAGSQEPLQPSDPNLQAENRSVSFRVLRLAGQGPR